MAYERYSGENAALLLIDHQIGTIEWMHSAPKDAALEILGEIYAALAQ